MENFDLFSNLSYILFWLVIGAGVVFILYLIWKIIQNRRKVNWISSQKHTLLLISVPKENEKTPLAAEQMFAALHGIYRNPAELEKEGALQEHISFEIMAMEKYIRFYVWVPRTLKDFVEGQIYAQYPDVEIHEVKDYTKDLDKSTKLHWAGTELVLNKSDVFPIKTFPNFDVDPLAGITGVLSKLTAGEQIWIQLLIRPVNDSWQERGITYVEKVRAGENPERAGWLNQISNIAWKFFKDLAKTAAQNPQTAAQTTAASTAEVKLPGPVETGLAGIETKITKLGFETKIRLMCLAPDPRIAKSKLQITAGAFKQFNVVNLNGFAVSDILVDNENFLTEYKARAFISPGYIFNIEELASIYHLPNVSVETPSIVWAGSKKGEPPANLPIEGSVPPDDLAIFAKTDFRNIETKFGIKTIDRRHHMYTIGKTGTGKTTMLENMAINDIRTGKGLAIVDPHGDFIERILNHIPEERINDVVVFDPADREFPVGFNILEEVNPDLKNIVASGVVGIFKKIFGESWGPRLEYILRNSLLALIDYPDSTLLGVMKILVDKNYRAKVVATIKDPVIKDFFINEYDKYDQKFRTEAIAPIQNKVGQFLSSSTIRNIVGQPKSTINMQDIMDNKKILLINLAKGKIGEDNSALLGAMMITKIQLTAMNRAHIPEEQRVDFYLYVDEFQNFATESFATIFSEARKYKLNIIVANQYIAQMPEVVRESVFGNVGTLISFRIGPSDAPYLAKEFMPIFEENDLINLDKYHIYIKMAIDGVTSPAFSAITLPPPSETLTHKEKCIAASRSKYGVSRIFVEEQIDKWNAQASAPMPGITSADSTNVQKTVTKPKLKPKGPSAIIKVGEKRYAEYVTATGDRWYQEVTVETPKKEEPKTEIPKSAGPGTESQSSSEAPKLEKTPSQPVSTNPNSLQELKEGEEIKFHS